MNEFNNLMNRLNHDDSKEKEKKKKKKIIFTCILLLLIIGVSVFFFIMSNNKKKLKDDDKEKTNIVEENNENEEENEEENSGFIENSELEIVLNENQPENENPEENNNNEENNPVKPEEENNPTPHEEENNNNNNNNNNNETVPVTYGFSYPIEIMNLELEDNHFKGTYKDNSAYFTISIFFDSNMKEVATNSELLQKQLIVKYPTLSELDDKYDYKVIKDKNWFIINGKQEQKYFSSGYTIFKQGIASIEIFSTKDNIENIYKDINIILNTGTKKE